MTRSKRAAAIVACGCLGLIPAWLIGRSVLDSVVESRSRSIESEIGKIGSGHAWAGSYYFGDGLGKNVSIRLAPEAGFVYEWHGCLGLYARNFGSVVERKDHLELRCWLPNGSGFHLDTEMVPVAWGPRRYLVPPRSMLDFVNEVNAGFEPRTGFHGEFPLRQSDCRSPVEGPPDLPPAYRKLLLARPLTTLVSSMGESRPDEWCRLTSVSIGIGSADGVFAGMKLYLEDLRLEECAVVTEVAEHASKATFTQRESTDDPPLIGWKLSTRPPADFGRPGRR